MIDGVAIVQTTVLEISQSALASWRLLPHCVQWYVSVFPGVSVSAQDYGTLSFGKSLVRPGAIAIGSDVAETATRLAIAFPRLIRRVIAVAIEEPFTVRLECEGLHEGMWGDIIYPTMRLVSFEERHQIVAFDGIIVSDRITIDVAAILTRLSGGGAVEPDKTARRGARPPRRARSRVRLQEHRH